MMTPPPLPDLFFYGLAGALLLSAMLVVTVRNPVHAILFLIGAFVQSAGLFMLLQAELLALSLVVVYVGAVAVLFLFIVMMLDIDLRGTVRRSSSRFAIFSVIMGIALGAGLIAGSLHTPTAPPPTTVTQLPIAAFTDPSGQVHTNAFALGAVLYTHYGAIFQLAGIILLLAMIGAIVLTLRYKSGVRRQSITDQVTRSATSVILAQPTSGQGMTNADIRYGDPL